MQLEPHTIITALSLVAGVAGTWALLNHRVRALEGLASSLRKEVTELRVTLEFVRTDQGRRIGVLETDTKELAGQFRGFRDGFGVGRRSRTAAQGNKIGGDGE